MLATSALAFSVAKYLGAAYLIFVGVKTIVSGGPRFGGEGTERAPDLATLFRQGALTNILNPKVALFFLALLPQFVDANASNPIPSFLALGLTFVATGTTWCLLVAIFAARSGRWLRSHARASNLLHRLSGGLFVALGLKLATAART